MAAFSRPAQRLALHLTYEKTKQAEKRIDFVLGLPQRRDFTS